MAICASRSLPGSNTLQQGLQTGSLVLEEAPLVVASLQRSVWILLSSRRLPVLLGLPLSLFL